VVGPSSYQRSVPLALAVRTGQEGGDRSRVGGSGRTLSQVAGSGRRCVGLRAWRGESGSGSGCGRRGSGGRCVVLRVAGIGLAVSRAVDSGGQACRA
jgi:hypothetical protein